MAAGSSTVQRYKTRTPHCTAAKAGKVFYLITVKLFQFHPIGANKSNNNNNNSNNNVM